MSALENKNEEITQKYLKSIINYNPDTGVFSRKTSTGKISLYYSGYQTRRGYIRITIEQVRYRAHRLAFLYMMGRWPKDQIDHINRVRNDNRWSNLRECDQTENNANSKLRRDNTSGYKGVSWNKRDKIWCAYIRFKGKLIKLGTFKTKEEAAITYNNNAIKLFGEFAFVNQIIKH